MAVKKIRKPVAKPIMDPKGIKPEVIGRPVMPGKKMGKPVVTPGRGKIAKPVKPKGRMYAGGSATFDESTGMRNLKDMVKTRMKRVKV